MPCTHTPAPQHTHGAAQGGRRTTMSPTLISPSFGCPAHSLRLPPWKRLPLARPSSSPPRSRSPHRRPPDRSPAPPRPPRPSRPASAPRSGRSAPPPSSHARRRTPRSASCRGRPSSRRWLHAGRHARSVSHARRLGRALAARPSLLFAAVPSLLLPTFNRRATADTAKSYVEENGEKQEQKANLSKKK